MFEILETLFLGGGIFGKYRRYKYQNANYEYDKAVRYAAMDSYDNRFYNELVKDSLDQEFMRKYISDFHFKKEVIAETEQALAQIHGPHGAVSLAPGAAYAGLDNNVCYLIWMVNRGSVPKRFHIASGMKPLCLSPHRPHLPALISTQ